MFWCNFINLQYFVSKFLSVCHCQNSRVRKEWLVLNLLCKLMNTLLVNIKHNVVFTCQREYISLRFLHKRILSCLLNGNEHTTLLGIIRAYIEYNPGSLCPSYFLLIYILFDSLKALSQ